jgi:hypothetical protein
MNDKLAHQILKPPIGIVQLVIMAGLSHESYIAMGQWTRNYGQ